MSYRLLGSSLLVVLSALCMGCDKIVTPTPQNNHQIDSDVPATAENGIQVTEGRPGVTEDIEKEIYISLNHRRKMMAAIKEKSGSSRGLQQMEDEFNLLSKGFMSRYGLSEAEIDDILNKGNSNNWE